MAGRQKTTNYFSHDSNARNDEKLVRLRMRHGAAGYGVYFMLLERLREEADYKSVKDYDMLAFDFRADASLIKSVVEDFGLFAFTPDGAYFYSESFVRRMEVVDTARGVRSAAGRRGMKRRWNSITELSENDNKVVAEVPETDNKVITELSETDNKVITELPEADNEVITMLPKTDNNKQTKKTNKVNKTLPDDGARTREGQVEAKKQPAAGGDVNERLWAAAFLADVWGVQNACAALHVSAVQLSELTGDFQREQAAKGVRHADAADFRRHLFDWARLHLTRSAEQTAKLQKQTNHATDKQKLIDEANHRDLSEL